MRYQTILLVVIFISANVSASRAQAPSTLSVQGLLTNPGGVPLATGDYDVVFSLYDTLSGGASVWTETHNGANPVPVVNGVFNATIGTKADFSTFVFDRPLYLGISVEGDPEIAPRAALASAPYANAMRGMYTFYHDSGTHRGHNVVGGDPGNLVDAGVAGATIAGGGGWIFTDPFPNRVGGHFATVGGGRENTAGALQSTVGGGAENMASGTTATVGGGKTNLASHDETTISGGALNTASGWRATIGGGAENTAAGDYSTVAGGGDNSAEESYATIQGGYRNAARGHSSLAAGYKARANHEGSFVWNDRSATSGNDSLLSTDSNQFIIRAVNGFGINAPPTNHGIYLKQQSHLPGYGIRLEFSLSSDYWDTHVASGQPESFYAFGYNGTTKGYISSIDGAYHAISDARLKEDVQSFHDVLPDVAQLHPSTYLFKDALESSPRSLGLLAQEVEPFFPELVSEKDGMKGMNYGGLSVVAIKAIQELYALVLEQSTEIERLRRIVDGR